MNVNLADKTIQHQMGMPFWGYAHWFEIAITKEDIDYLTNVIKQDKCYELINSSFSVDLNYERYSKLQRSYAKINQIVFYDKFYNSEKCPKGIRLILFVYLGLLRDYVNEAFPSLLNDRYRNVEQWLDNINRR